MIHGSAHTDAPVRLGELVGGRYEVTRLIGRGGMGVVVEARRANHAQRVALKVLHAKHLGNQEAIARFTKEGHAAAAVRGEHTVRLLDAGEHKGAPFLVMELLDGRDLDAVLADGPLPLETAALYILQACEGIAEVHAHGMVHRDLKPSNLFLTHRADGSPLVKILDFGIAKGVAATDPSLLVQTQTLIAMGTPLYMSPEQIRSSREVDARADVWSLGAIFYELVAGQPAFGGNTVTHITAQVLEATPKPLSTLGLNPPIPKQVDNVVASALAKNADARFIDVACLASALEPFAGPAGAGVASRCARILAGSMRRDAALTSPPVAHDGGAAEDNINDTMRFDRQRRRRALQISIAALSVFALAMSATIIVVMLNGPRANGMTLAKRGLSASFDPTRAANSASGNPQIGPPAGSSVILTETLVPSASAAASLPAPTPPAPSMAAPSVSNSKLAAPPAHSTPARTTKPAQSTPAPTTAQTPPPTTTVFDPFRDRN